MGKNYKETTLDKRILDILSGSSRFMTAVIIHEFLCKDKEFSDTPIDVISFRCGIMFGAGKIEMETVMFDRHKNLDIFRYLQE